jgi:TRAP-type C4-dicarboxylate transport system permease small subunit
MALGAGNVVGRIFGYPFNGTYELVGFAGAILVALALAESQRKKDHILVDVLSRRYPRWLRRTIDGLRYVICTGFFGWIAWQLLLHARGLAESGEVSETLKWPYAPVVYTVALGFAALTVMLAVDLVQVLRGKDAPA